MYEYALGIVIVTGEVFAAGANFLFTLVIKPVRRIYFCKLQKLVCAYLRSARWGGGQKHSFVPPRFCQEAAAAPLPPYRIRRSWYLVEERGGRCPGFRETSVTQRIWHKSMYFGSLHLLRIFVYVS